MVALSFFRTDGIVNDCAALGQPRRGVDRDKMKAFLHNSTPMDRSTPLLLMIPKAPRFLLSSPPLPARSSLAVAAVVAWHAARSSASDTLVSIKLMWENRLLFCELLQVNLPTLK